jgi:hypothetical protein
MENFFRGILIGICLSSVIFFILDNKVWIGIYKLIDYRNYIQAQIKAIDKRQFSLIVLWLKAVKEEKKDINFEEKIRQMHREKKELEITFEVLKKVCKLFGIEKDQGGEE